MMLWGVMGRETFRLILRPKIGINPCLKITALLTYAVISTII